MKTEDWVRDALQELGQQAAEQPVTDDMMATGIRYGNRLMQSHAYLGLGFTVVTSASDTVTIPAFAEDWAVKALAIRLAGQFGAFDGLDALKVEADETYVSMLRNIDLDISQDMPDTLPVGTGNQTQTFSKFFPRTENNELTEASDFVILEG